MQSAPGHGDLYKVTKGASVSVTAIQAPSAPPSPSEEYILGDVCWECHPKGRSGSEVIS